MCVHTCSCRGQRLRELGRGQPSPQGAPAGDGAQILLPQPGPSPCWGWPVPAGLDGQKAAFVPSLGGWEGQKLAPGWLAAAAGDVFRSPSSLCLRCCLLHNRPKNNLEGGRGGAASPRDPSSWGRGRDFLVWGPVSFWGLQATVPPKASAPQHWTASAEYWLPPQPGSQDEQGVVAMASGIPENLGPLALGSRVPARAAMA